VREYLLVLLISARRRFTARPDPRSLSRVLAVLLVGPVVSTGLGGKARTLTVSVLLNSTLAPFVIRNR